MLRLNRRAMIGGLGTAAMMPLIAGAPRAAETVRQLTVSKRTLEVKGRAASVYSLTGENGKPGLEFLVEERFRVNLRNDTDTATLIHWHGLTPPNDQDGVPVLSQPLLQPGQSYDYDFPNRHAGTHWMHSHVGLQEQQLLAAPLIVRETTKPLFDTQEHVVLLHDFTFRDPQEILRELTGGGGAHAGHSQPKAGTDPEMDHSKMGGMAMDGMAMGGMVNDVVFDAYLANDRTLDDPEVVAVEKAGVLRLRIINAAAASNMWIDLGGLQGELIAVDGNAIHPVAGSVFPIAIAQRADIRIRIPREGGGFPVLFRPEGVAERTGIILATPGATVGRIAGEGEMPPVVDLSQELIYRAVAKLRDEPIHRTELVMLTGGGADYVWGLNGKSGMHDTIFSVREGERLGVIMHNMTGMAHPMHLHGHYFKVVAINGTAIDGAIRDVVLVPPGQSVTVMFDADNPGNWAFHCHHAYHMNAGMMGKISYTSAA